MPGRKRTGLKIWKQWGGNICFQGLEAALWNLAQIPRSAQDFLLKMVPRAWDATGGKPSSGAASCLGFGKHPEAKRLIPRHQCLLLQGLISQFNEEWMASTIQDLINPLISKMRSVWRMKTSHKTRVPREFTSTHERRDIVLTVWVLSTMIRKICPLEA